MKEQRVVWIVLFLFIWNINQQQLIVEGCQVCSPWSMLLRYDSPRGKHTWLGLTIAKSMIEKKSFLTLATLGVAFARATTTPMTTAHHSSKVGSTRYRHSTEFEREQPSSEDDDTKSSKKEDQTNNNSDKGKDVTSTAMISALGVYKNFISPLLPPACRFVPTCSQYGVQAIEQFGPSKGVILIAWRLLRCSPVGGKGYDPPKWPPVPYTYSSY